MIQVTSKQGFFAKKIAILVRVIDIERNANNETAEPLNSRKVRRVYLVTYSQANLEIVPSRESFARIVLDAFNNARQNNNSSVVYWVCSQEPHANGGVHYHMAVKLERRRRWLHVRNYIDREYGIIVNFSGCHENYYTAWAYTTKEDISAVQSENHPDLGRIGAPITSNACSANRAGSKRKRKALSIFDVSQLAVEKGIKTRLELLAFANQQKQEGRTDLAEFIANRRGKAVEEALSVG